jgi:hypothetical protein
MGHIDSLTVMSADGASDIVKNATRAMIESTTAIKGLTGLDVPSLIGGAMGRGFGERLRTGDGDGGSDPGSAADRISEIAGAGLSALKAQTAAAAAHAAEEADVAKEKAADEAAKAKSVGDALKAAGAAEKAAVEAKVAPAVAKVAPEAAKVWPSDGNVSQWTKWLADQLHLIPDIRVYDALRLSDLASKGPAPARAIWATAQAVLGKDYGSMTVGDLLKRFHP